MQRKKAQSRQRISNIYIYLYVSDQSVYTGSEIASKKNDYTQDIHKVILSVNPANYLSVVAERGPAPTSYSPT